METELKVLTFKVSNLTTELHVANEEIERLKKSNVMPARVRPPLVIEPDETESQLIAEREKVEGLEIALSTLHEGCYMTPADVDRANARFGNEREKVEKLRKAIEDYVNNDIGRKDTLRNLEQTLADTV